MSHSVNNTDLTLNLAHILYIQGLNKSYGTKGSGQEERRRLDERFIYESQFLNKQIFWFSAQVPQPKHPEDPFQWHCNALTSSRHIAINKLKNMI